MRGESKNGQRFDDSNKKLYQKDVTNNETNCTAWRLAANTFTTNFPPKSIDAIAVHSAAVMAGGGCFRGEL